MTLIFRQNNFQNVFEFSMYTAAQKFFTPYMGDITFPEYINFNIKMFGAVG